MSFKIVDIEVGKFRDVAMTEYLYIAFGTYIKIRKIISVVFFFFVRSPYKINWVV